ncbi:MAG: flagellar biosynthesis anti-sigma factor FlgM [Candidatus Nitrosoglobus sp.]|jgi:negative regulator of flagellin synthesis FlgM
MSTEITGPSGYINTSIQKQPETVATDHSHSLSAENAGTISPVEKTINLTNIAAAQIKKAEASLTNTRTVNNQKIEQIKQSLLEGSYQIDSRRIADKLIALELSLSK